MKTKFLPVVCCVLLSCYSINSNAQNANRTLSNLTSPTAVNQSLIPGTNNTINLGSGGRGGLNWNNLYLGDALYLDGDKTLHAPGKTNFFVGTHAGNTSLTGNYNTGIGQFSLFNLSSGLCNTANGYQALYRNSAGEINTANGYQSLFYNTTGLANTANGYQSLYSNTEGIYNTANGVFALYSNTSGYWNTANGYQSLYSNTTGYNNTALGYWADVTAGDLTNATAIGSGASVNASNKVRVGNIAVTSIGGQVSWSTFSDGRYKKNIKEDVKGLSFINSLRPVTYTVDINSLNEYFDKGRKHDSAYEKMKADMQPSADEAAKTVYNGFIAQDVEAAAKKLNYEFSGVDKPQSKDGLYGLRYGDFVVPLVKAVQELSKMNDALQKQNDEQQKDIDDLKSEIRNLKSEIDKLKSATISSNSFNADMGDASLAQNIPNPFTTATTISYSLPSKFTAAQIIITDKNGKRLKQLNISGSGNGVVNIDASALPAGAYNYSLIVDGRIISSKQMIVGK